MNVVDIDTTQVTKAWTQPGGRQLTATDKATGYNVRWKAPGDDKQWFDYDLHHSEPHQRDGIHGAVNGNENWEQRRPMVRPRDLHSNGDTTTSGRAEQPDRRVKTGAAPRQWYRPSLWAYGSHVYSGPHSAASPSVEQDHSAAATPCHPSMSRWHQGKQRRRPPPTSGRVVLKLCQLIACQPTTCTLQYAIIPHTEPIRSSRILFPQLELSLHTPLIMPTEATTFTRAAVDYFTALRQIQSIGTGTAELSLYGPLNNLLNAVGATLRPNVFSVQQPANQGAGHPDFALYASHQIQNGTPKSGQKPERGVIEVKALTDDAWITAASEQVSRYWDTYHQVLITNYRDFVLVSEDAAGHPIVLETFRLADSQADFDTKIQNPRAFANNVGVALGEYLSRVLSHSASLTDPSDLAQLLASYARDALARVAASEYQAPSMNYLRDALEASLGMKFEGDDGNAFFRSALVQTLFYGIFSSWVIWSRQKPAPTVPFSWRESHWNAQIPVLGALFHQMSGRTQLQTLGLVEVLDWAAAALVRVDRDAFFAKFSEGEAVPYFYEPFLKAFDPGLRDKLGVWYTPPEVVRYMVARVDRALKEDIGIPDGLAGENVYVLDPCCGTGAYLSEVLRCIAANLHSSGSAALTGAWLKKAATERVFGFEIMPAPYVVAHLQVGLTMQELNAPLSDSHDERAGIFLTNALTGWEPTVQHPLPFPELEQERERAERVKQNKPVLVILGNPPYNGFAGVAVAEERGLSEAYRTTQQVRPPEGQGLNDPYVRFFRMAERRIAEKTGQGVICFISNYSWLDGLSFTGMRERYLDAFDLIRIDNLHGDRIISEYAPDGHTSETIFAMQGHSPGIRVGTSVTLLSKRSQEPSTSKQVLYRDFHQARASDRRQALLDSLNAPGIDDGYSAFVCNIALGLPFKPTSVGDHWHDWPALPDLFRTSFPGVKTSRDNFLVDIDLDRLRRRLNDYFDPDLNHEEIARRYPGIMQSIAHFDAHAVRDTLLKRGGPTEDGFVRYAYRPFDTRWLYWDDHSMLLDRPRPEYKPHVFPRKPVAGGPAETP